MTPKMWLADQTPENREAAAVKLDDAAVWLEANHWTQHYAAVGADGYALRDVVDVKFLESCHGGVKACCAAGVIALAVGGTELLYSIGRDAVIQTLPDGQRDLYGNRLAAWNDRPERTKDEVVFALRAGADYLRSFSGGPQQ